MSPKHKISVELKNFPTEIVGDPKLLDNVFTNLLSNAVKYSSNRPIVEISGFEEAGSVVLKVRDLGVGIPASELPRITERFFRASTSNGISGTGIGLNLVRMLVEQHEGSMTIDGLEGEWTEVTLRLPVLGPAKPVNETDELEYTAGCA